MGPCIGYHQAMILSRRQLRLSPTALQGRLRWGAHRHHHQKQSLLLLTTATATAARTSSSFSCFCKNDHESCSPASSSVTAVTALPSAAAASAGAGDGAGAGEILSSRYLAWCVAASAAASLFGLDDHVRHRCSNINNTNHHLRGDNNQVPFVRGYHSTRAACDCESSSKNPSNKNDNDYDKSDSFFDMAHQWAQSKSKNSNEDGNARTTKANENGSNKQSTDNESSNNNIQTPEELLEAMGILGGSRSSGRDGQSDRDTSATTGSENDSSKGMPNDGSEDENSSNLKGMVKKVLFKFDKFQSSFPNPSSPSANEEGETKTKESIKEDDDDNDSDDKKTSIFSEFLALANSASLFTRKSSDSPPDIEELIKQAQSIANHASGSNTSSQSSTSSSFTSSGFLSQVLYFQQNAQSIQRAFESSFGPHLSNTNVKDLFQSFPSIQAMHYYLECQDSIKTPSWKRRLHRFQKDVDVMKVEELNEALIMSELSYEDNVEDIRTGLERLYTGKNSKKPQWELLFCDTKSRPNKPSHFLAIQKNASPCDDTLHVLMVVRGTKSMSDLITDAMMEASEYDYALPGNDNDDGGKYDGNNVIQGFAHSGMVQSGKYLVQRHRELLSTLLKLSKKRKMEITLIGHSLGAGAATIAAMEWNSKPFQQQDIKGVSSVTARSKDDIQVSAHVIGFGCPALLSQSLSLATKDYVTTVIADADFIPRMSGATLVNLLLDIRGFDYRVQAERDVEQALRELQSRFFLGSSDLLPSSAAQSKKKSKLAFNIMDEEDIQTVMGYVHRGLEKVSTTPSTKEEANTKSDTTEEGSKEEVKTMQPVLFPPGECIHFYRDGSGISGSHVPSNFFHEIDVARTMIDDHLISSGYRRIFLSLMRDFHKDDHFSFEKQDQEK